MENMITINEAIKQLEKAAEESNRGGEAVVHICVNGIEYVPVTEIKVENDFIGENNDPYGAVCLIMSKLCDEQFVDSLCGEG